MAQTQINGTTQVKANSIGPGQVSSGVIVAGGTNAFTANQSMGGNLLQSVGTPAVSSDAATKGYVDAALNAASGKYAAVAGTNTETLTIAAGAVTQIAGTTVNGVSPAVNDYVLIPNAPASTGAAQGATLTSQPANGLYQVTNNTTNLTVARAADMTGTINPMGATVTVVGGSVWGGADMMVTTPSSSAAFTYGTGNIAFTQMSGAGEITTDTTLTKAGNQLSRAAITGDVAISAGSNASTIGAGAVTLGKQANLAANSVIGNNTGSSATPVAVPLSVSAGTPAASTIPLWDASLNLAANSHIMGVTTTPTAAGTTTLTVTSTQFQQFTGATTQILVLPNATTLKNGTQYWVANRSTGAVTVNMNGGSNLTTVAAGSLNVITLVNNGTTAGTWDTWAPGGGGATVPGAGIVKSNGSVLQTATAGTDYMAPADFVTRETPSGTVNGSTTAFTLANTPIAGTEMVFLNGVLQDAGAGNDYTISGTTITMLSAPLTGDKLRVTYQK